MKKLILTLAIALMSTTSFAGDLEKCENVSELARKIMEARQLNMPMSKLLRVFKNEDGSINQGIKFMIIDAYDTPRFSTEEYRRGVIRDFSNEWFKGCIR